VPALGISKRTLRQHLENIKRKLASSPIPANPYDYPASYCACVFARYYAAHRLMRRYTAFTFLHNGAGISLSLNKK
jgi:hypothetical protein